jgi:hypothetical protein
MSSVQATFALALHKLGDSAVDDLAGILHVAHLLQRVTPIRVGIHHVRNQFRCSLEGRCARPPTHMCFTLIPQMVCTRPARVVSLSRSLSLSPSLRRSLSLSLPPSPPLSPSSPSPPLSPASATSSAPSESPLPHTNTYNDTRIPAALGMAPGYRPCPPPSAYTYPRLMCTAACHPRMSTAERQAGVAMLMQAAARCRACSRSGSTSARATG